MFPGILRHRDKPSESTAAVEPVLRRVQFRRSLQQRVMQRAWPALFLIALGCQREPQWRGTPIRPARTATDVVFADSAGATVHLLPANNDAALVFFGYTNCPDVCPTTLADWARVKRALGERAKRVRFVFVTVDPERDTPAVAQRFAAQFDTAFVALSATPDKIIALQNMFGVASAMQASHDAANHLMAHSSESFLVDSSGRILVKYPFGAGWDAMSADLEQLLR